MWRGFVLFWGTRSSFIQYIRDFCNAESVQKMLESRFRETWGQRMYEHLVCDTKVAVCSLAVPACVVANPVWYAVEALGDLTLTAGPAEQLLFVFCFGLIWSKHCCIGPFPLLSITRAELELSVLWLHLGPSPSHSTPCASWVRWEALCMDTHGLSPYTPSPPSPLPCTQCNQIAY